MQHYVRQLNKMISRANALQLQMNDLLDNRVAIKINADLHWSEL